MRKDAKIFLAVGLFFMLTGVIMGVVDIWRVINYDRVDATLYKVYLDNGNENQRRAIIAGYEYDGEEYGGIVLGGGGPLMMKDGNSYTVLIDPDNPEEVFYPSYLLVIISIGCGGFAVYTGSIGLRARKRTSED
ncbi:hypothetical protein SAMN06296952_1385 [Oscillospiraceae bacterium]|nr:hypothetical protein SAMN06296952_1385 [Oscillospiraceae bacterium]